MSKRSEATQGELVKTAPSLPAEVMEQYEAAAGAGSEEVASEDIAIPLLRIIQKGSPQVDPQDAAYMDGAVAVGDILNTITGEVFELSEKGNSLAVVPCHFRKEVVAWRIREKGGGLRERYTPEEAEPLFGTCTKDDKGRDILPDGETQLVPTANHYVMFTDGSFAVIPMASTQMKKSRAWNTMVTTWRLQGKNGPFNPPRWARFYDLGTVGEKNEKGSWMGWTVKPGAMVPADLYNAARKFHEIVRTGRYEIVDGEDPVEPNGEQSSSATSEASA